MPCLQQRSKLRAQPSECARLPLFLPREHFEIELAMPRLLRLERAFFYSKALLLFPPSVSFLFLLRQRSPTRIDDTHKDKNVLLASASGQESHPDLSPTHEVALTLGEVYHQQSSSRAL